MNTARALFPGAMGPEGFISCFEHLIPQEILQRRLILKGGPGVGKSTFMRRLHAALCPGDETATLYFCSGDPDSLDAIAVPHAGLLILDGTAPHIVDPLIPGARDTLINLGACLNEASMRSRLPCIRSCMGDHAAVSRRARAYMQAACALRRDCSAVIASAVHASRLESMTRALIQSVLCSDAPHDSQASLCPVITDAMTPKGELCLLSSGCMQRVIRLAGHWAMDLTPVLQSLSQAVRSAGYAVEEHLCPMVPGMLMHLTIPSLSVLITTSDLLPSELLFDFAACIPSGALLRHECALEQAQASIQLMMQRSAGAMAQAKQLHDELETFYVPNMDFGAWQKIFDETLTSLLPS